MKKAFFVLFIIAIAYRAGAQQTLVKPTDSLLLKLYTPFKVKPADSSLYGKFFKLQPLTAYNQLKPTPDIGNAEIFYSAMPVVKVGAAENMPVAKIGADGNYTMPVKKYKVVNPLIVVKPVTP